MERRAAQPRHADAVHLGHHRPSQGRAQNRADAGAARASSERPYAGPRHRAGHARAAPGAAGRPLGQAIIRILDDKGAELPRRQIGLIYARQPAYPDFTYNNNAQARGKIERDGLLSLGDMGFVDDEGYLYVCDRASDMVISGGVNIYPAEIEAALTMMPGVRDCAVF